MRALRRFALWPLLLAALVGCGRRDEGDPGVSGAPANAAETGATAADATAEPPPAATVRSIALAQAGWRFQLDLAAVPGQDTRADVLATPPTVGAPPQRRSASLPGEFVEAFATDLDGDGGPELLLWQREGSAGEGLLEGWRWRHDGEAENLTLPALDGDLATGWRGRDQFGVQGDRLVRSFPLYRDEDDNASPSAGFVRVVRYRLEAGGLAVDETMLEPMDGSPQAELLAR